MEHVQWNTIFRLGTNNLQVLIMSKLQTLHLGKQQHSGTLEAKDLYNVSCTCINRWEIPHKTIQSSPKLRVTNHGREWYHVPKPWVSGIPWAQSTQSWLDTSNTTIRKQGINQVRYSLQVTMWGYQHTMVIMH